MLWFRRLCIMLAVLAGASLVASGVWAAGRGHVAHLARPSEPGCFVDGKCGVLDGAPTQDGEGLPGDGDDGDDGDPDGPQDDRRSDTDDDLNPDDAVARLWARSESIGGHYYVTSEPYASMSGAPAAGVSRGVERPPRR